MERGRENLPGEPAAEEGGAVHVGRRACVGGGAAVRAALVRPTSSRPTSPRRTAGPGRPLRRGGGGRRPERLGVPVPSGPTRSSGPPAAAGPCGFSALSRLPAPCAPQGRPDPRALAVVGHPDRRGAPDLPSELLMPSTVRCQTSSSSPTPAACTPRAATVSGPAWASRARPEAPEAVDSEPGDVRFHTPAACTPRAAIASGPSGPSDPCTCGAAWATGARPDPRTPRGPEVVDSEPGRRPVPHPPPQPARPARRPSLGPPGPSRPARTPRVPAVSAEGPSLTPTASPSHSSGGRDRRRGLQGHRPTGHSVVFRRHRPNGRTKGGGLAPDRVHTIG
ncbi:hypothetical protein M2157_002951 [Streptomyces sp. SAI-127]|nr:hypothetical protein [Streptomyces sp. SAI-127]